METCSHLLEIRKVMNKCLVCDIQVQDITLSATGLHIHTNKWLHLEDWLEIDTAIETLLQPFGHSETLEGFQTKQFHLGGAIRIDCTKTKVNKSHKRILGEDKKYLPVALDVQVTKINTVALMEQITMFEEQLNQINIKDRSSSPTIKAKHEKNDKESFREYDPTAHSDVLDQNSNDYVPYTASAKTPTSALDNSGSTVSEPYSPRPINIESSSPGNEISESPNLVPNYRPARIAHVKSSKESDPTENNNNNDKPKSSRRKHSPESKSSKSSRFKEPSSIHVSKRPASQSSSKQTKNSELFGSDDSDLELKTSASAIASECPTLPSQSNDKDSRRKKMKLRHDAPVSSSHKNSLDGWLSKGSIKSGTEKEKPLDKQSNGKSSSKKSSRHESSSKRHPHPPLKDDKKMCAENEAQPLKELAAIRETLKAKRKTPPPDIKILSLTHLTLQEILDTFDGIRPVLDPIFKNYSKKSKVTGYDGINHMKTIMLIDDKKQLQMLNFLRDNYQPEEKGVPSLTDLYINAMVPEWTINVFMKEYKFTRSEAIDRLQAQEDITVRQKRDEILDTP